jgi:hypothetical protein
VRGVDVSGDKEGKINTHKNLKKMTTEERPKMTAITYYRHPNAAEIKFGEGALHYLDIPVSECTRIDGTVKSWVTICGMRYWCIGWYKNMRL